MCNVKIELRMRLLRYATPTNTQDRENQNGLKYFILKCYKYKEHKLYLNLHTKLHNKIFWVESNKKKYLIRIKYFFKFFKYVKFFMKCRFRIQSANKRCHCLKRNHA